MTTTDLVPTEKTVNPRFWMDERSVDTLSQKLTVPLQLQLDSVSDGLKEEYRSLLGSLREDLYSLKMEISAFGGRPLAAPAAPAAPASRLLSTYAQKCVRELLLFLA